MIKCGKVLEGIRVIGILNSHELFGHERGNIEVWKALAKNGAEVCVGVTTANGGGAVRREVEILGFETFAIPFGTHWSKKFFIENPLVLIFNLWRLILSNIVLAKKIRQFRPTHLHMGTAFAFSFVGIAVRLSRVPLVVRLGDAPPLSSGVQLALWRYFIRAARTVVANSEYVWRTSASASDILFGRKAHVIYNLAPSGMQKAISPSYQVGHKNIVYVGQMTREKGVFEFLRSARIVIMKYPESRFHLVGGSSHTLEAEAELRTLVEELGIEGFVVFHGWVDNVCQFLSGADAHVAPSVWEEPFANVVMESKREGTPSVVFPSGGLPEMIRHRVDGFICSEKTHLALAEGIVWILDHPPEAMRELRQTVAADCFVRFGEPRFREAWSSTYHAAQILGEGL